MAAPSHSRPFHAFWLRARPWVLGIVAAGALGCFYYFLATRGPRRITSVETRKVDASATSALSVDIAALEAKASVVAGSPTSADARLGWLENALAKQRELFRLDPQANNAEVERLQRLEQKVASEKAWQADRRIVRLMAEAEAGGQSDVETAVAKLREALTAQVAVNQSNASLSEKNLVRESQLKQRIETLDSEPLHTQVKTSLENAEAMMAQKQFAGALEAFQSARTMQAKINHDFPRSPHANLVLFDKVEAEIASLQAAVPAQKIDEDERAGDAALAAGKNTEAAQVFLSAKTAQQTLNAEHPRSRFVSLERVEQLEIKRQTALSAIAIMQVMRLDREIAGLLKDRDIPKALAKIREAVELMTKATTEFSKSTRLAEMPDARLTYLASRAPEIQAVQEDVFGMLVPLVAGSSVRVMTREVPQSLYQKVMAANPSRQPGERRPVDSVSWQDAQVFCQWLSWQLGRRVRLPTETEFAALRADEARAPSFSGLSDGVEEWLDADNDARQAPLASATAGTGPDVIKRASKTERGRHIGFRVVVE